MYIWLALEKLYERVKMGEAKPRTRSVKITRPTASTAMHHRR